MTLETEHLRLFGVNKTTRHAHICLLLAHNERNLLEPFLEHYRGFGDIAFIVVDDRSSDGSAEFLAAQPDVTVLMPKDGSTYAQHKREWRGQVLDQIAHGRWILAPDADEHLVWHGAPQRSFATVIDDLEAEGAAALYAMMVDMYADKPLEEQTYEGGSLLRAFPLFDDPGLDPTQTWMERGAGRFLQNWPTPQLSVVGGMRQRLIASQSTERAGLRPLGRRLFGRLRDHRGTGSTLSRLFTKHPGKTPPTLLTKVPLVKWQRGFRFYGGAHSLNAPVALGSERAALLHFPVTRGAEGMQRVISRGQHTSNSGHYVALLEVAGMNPTFHGTRELRTLTDLDGIILPPQRRT